MLISAAEARLQLPSLQGTVEDEVLVVLIQTAGEMIATHLGYPAASASAESTAESTSYTLYLNGPGGRDLVLPVWPVTAITSIYDDEDRSYAASSLVSSGDYAIEEGATGRVLLTATATHGAWSTGKRAIKATFTAGYTTIPSWLKHAARLTVRALYDLRTAQGQTSRNVGNQSVSLRDQHAIPEEARRILAPHRLPRAVGPW